MGNNNALDQDLSGRRVKSLPDSGRANTKSSDTREITQGTTWPNPGSLLDPHAVLQPP